MERGYPSSDLNSFDDHLPDRANEERASRHILYAMVAAASAIAGLYAFGVMCGLLAGAS